MSKDASETTIAEIRAANEVATRRIEDLERQLALMQERLHMAHHVINIVRVAVGPG